METIGLIKRFVYAFTCLFGSITDIEDILPSVKKEDHKEEEDVKEEAVPKIQNSPVAYTFGLMDRFFLIKIGDNLLDFVTILSKDNHPVVKQNLVILNLKNMLDKEIFFENANDYGRISSFSEKEVVIAMVHSGREYYNMINTFKYEPEVICVQEKDIGIHRLKKGSKFIDFVGVNMDVIKESYLRWTRDWPLISSMVKKK